MIGRFEHSLIKRNRKFVDSPLEGDGFEPSVPRFARLVHFPAPTPRSGIAEPVAVLVEFGAALLLGPAHLVDDLVDQFNDMEFVEGDLGLWQALGVPAMNAGLMLMHTSKRPRGSAMRRQVRGEGRRQSLHPCLRCGPARSTSGLAPDPPDSGDVGQLA